MILYKYLLKRFFNYLIFTNIILVLLFSSIDFFEKFIRIKNVEIYDITYAIFLGLLPSFFEYLPLSSWLSTTLLLKEMHQQNELEIIPLLGIKYQSILTLFLSIGLFLFLFSIIFTENISNKLLYKSEKLKTEKLKKKSNHKIINKWLILNENTFCHFNLLDLKQNLGSGLILLYLDKNFSTQKIVVSKNFKIKKKHNLIILENGDLIHQPSFFAQIQIFSEQQNINQLAQTIISSKKLIPNNSWNEILHLFLKRILSYLQFVLYPLLTLCLFFAPFKINRYRWLLILFPYPSLTLFTAMSDFIIQTGQTAFISIIPYLIFIVAIIFLWQKIYTGSKAT